ncbi:MAG: 3-oxoacyl-ACP reductase FabG [Bacteroidetes bacterium]|nr:3-oxoacyl-ACP reductase FabG [Bacteroidota bacterium]
MEIDFKNKVVLITGGSRGIGAACVKLFADSGAQIAFTYNTNEDAANQIIAGYNFELKIKAYKVNAADEDNIIECVRAVKNEFGRIDILVNNAGIWKQAKVDEMNLKEWNETINVNLTGCFLFIKHVVPVMKENGFGRIINIASTAGQRGEPYHSHYASSKGGVISLTKSLAVELAKFNITTNCVAPGWVYTDMSNPVITREEKDKEIKEYIPLGRAAYPEEVAGPVLFLASILADHINGEILNVNGGSELCG